MFLQVADAVPHTEGGVETCDIIDTLVPGVRLCSRATTAMVAVGEAVEEGQVEVLGEKRWQLGLTRRVSGEIGHGLRVRPGRLGFQRYRSW